MSSGASEHKFITCCSCRYASSILPHGKRDDEEDRTVDGCDWRESKISSSPEMSPVVESITPHSSSYVGVDNKETSEVSSLLDSAGGNDSRGVWRGSSTILRRVGEVECWVEEQRNDMDEVLNELEIVAEESSDWDQGLCDRRRASVLGREILLYRFLAERPVLPGK